MLYILHGEDDFSLNEVLSEIRKQLGDDDLTAANTTVLKGRDVTPDQLSAVCETIPFLAPRRLVIVEGLLGRFEQQEKGKRAPKTVDTGWLSLRECIGRMPESTILVLIDGKLSRKNPILTMLAPLAQVEERNPLKGAMLKEWMHKRAEQKGCDISGAATGLLADLVGSNLWLLSNEIDKLCTFANGRPVEENDVRLLVADARESNIFAMVDAILERRYAQAARMLHSLQEDGAAPPYILYMITRQFRLLVQAQELMNRKLKDADIARSLGIGSDYALRKTREQARRHSRERLEEAYRKLLETDISIKTGRYKGDKGELALDLLISELCGEDFTAKPGRR